MNVSGALKSVSRTFRSASMKFLGMSIYIIKHCHPSFTYFNGVGDLHFGNCLGVRDRGVQF
jgi:hypothetical protein